MAGLTGWKTWTGSSPIECAIPAMFSDSVATFPKGLCKHSNAFNDSFDSFEAAVSSLSNTIRMKSVLRIVLKF
uniref:Secreted protein n=1 Tax=Caenorhabditis tropicalis TaxID=1561998 RepID=A0A1I7SYM6_9PELO